MARSKPSSSHRKYDENLAKLKARVSKIKADAVDGEAQESPLEQPELPGLIPDALRLAAAAAAAAEASAEDAGDMESPDKPGGRRKPRKRLARDVDEVQGDFFVPSVYDLSTKDARLSMDVAIFRLSKRDLRANTTARIELADGFVEIKSGPLGMASVWDFDVVLMAISYLTRAANEWRAGRGEKPGRVFRPHISEILRFAKRSVGGRQYEEIESVVERLRTTSVESVRTIRQRGGRTQRVSEAESFITRYKIISDEASGKVATVEIEVASWIYEAAFNTDVLTVHPSYFLIESGLGRFLYRLARKAAGRTVATYGFRTIYERSLSTSTFKEFSRMLRALIEADQLPEYSLSEEDGEEGPVLRMTYRAGLEGKEEDPALPMEGGEGG
ncbi:replication initiator protein A [Xenophilus azovorans]|uniref:replication initiator protein A n=1 Tax=Xenophilus azovorans TaxID=151755 RepID=UPI0006893EA2|nr:replication initiator protein A [Xenophilus azovorans]